MVSRRGKELKGENVLQPLTVQQKKVYEALRTAIATHGYAQTLQELTALIGVSAIATVFKHLANLERKGYIKRGSQRARDIALLVLENDACPTCGQRSRRFPPGFFPRIFPHQKA